MDYIIAYEEENNHLWILYRYRFSIYVRIRISFALYVEGKSRRKEGREYSYLLNSTMVLYLSI